MVCHCSCYCPNGLDLLLFSIEEGEQYSRPSLAIFGLLLIVEQFTGHIENILPQGASAKSLPSKQNYMANRNT